MTYRLYGDPGSGSSMVELALAYIGAEVALESVSLEDESQREDAYAAVNPHRKLPTLITPAGETLTESAAILLILDERHRDAGLLPAPGSPDRALAMRWLLFVATELYPVIEINDYPERFTPDPAAAPGVRERAKEIWRSRWLVVERAIAGDPWLLESGLCATDLYIAATSRWAGQDDWRPSHIPRVEAIAHAIAAHPRLAEVWHRNFPSA